MKKSESMRLEEWLEFFRKYKEIKIFHIQHLKTLTHMDSHTLRVTLQRLNRRKVVQRICRSFYANPFNAPTLEEVSAEIYKPSYISLEAALYRHGILSQIPYTLTCVTAKLPREFETAFGHIQYRQVKKEYFFGFVREGSVFYAEPEKALVDFLYLNRLDDIKGMLSEFNIGRLNASKLKSYLRRLKINVSISILKS